MTSGVAQRLVMTFLTSLEMSMEERILLYKAESGVWLGPPVSVLPKTLTARRMMAIIVMRVILT